MSWENDDYTIETPKVVASAAPKQPPVNRAALLRAKNMASSPKASTPKAKTPNKNDDEAVLDYSGKGIDKWETIEADPNYDKAVVLILNNNKLNYIDGHYLPEKLRVLNLDDNEITEIKRPEKFPKTLEVFWIENNKLTELPQFPPGLDLKDYRYAGNPLKPAGNFIETETANSNTKAIRWYTTEVDAKKLFTDDERKDYHVRTGDGTFFSNLKDRVRKSLDPKRVCRDKIGDGYVSKTIDKVDHLLVEVHKGEIVAFALVDTGTEGQLHIELICADPANKGGGSRIIDLLRRYFHKHPDITRMTLDAIPDAHGFYIKKGFRSCITGQMCPMEMVRSSNANLRDELGSVSGGGKSRPYSRMGKTRRSKKSSLGSMINSGISAIYPKRFVNTVDDVLTGRKTPGNALNAVTERKLKLNKKDRLRKKRLDSAKAAIQKQRLALARKADAQENMRMAKKRGVIAIAAAQKKLQRTIRNTDRDLRRAARRLAIASAAVSRGQSRGQSRKTRRG
jgi:hypothetical protein